MTDNEEFVAVSMPGKSKSDARTHFAHPEYKRNGIR